MKNEDDVKRRTEIAIEENITLFNCSDLLGERYNDTSFPLPKINIESTKFNNNFNSLINTIVYTSDRPEKGTLREETAHWLEYWINKNSNRIDKNQSLFTQRIVSEFIGGYSRLRSYREDYSDRGLVSDDSLEIYEIRIKTKPLSELNKGIETAKGILEEIEKKLGYDPNEIFINRAYKFDKKRTDNDEKLIENISKEDKKKLDIYIKTIKDYENLFMEREKKFKDEADYVHHILGYTYAQMFGTKVLDDHPDLIIKKPGEVLGILKQEVKNQNKESEFEDLYFVEDLFRKMVDDIPVYQKSLEKLLGS